MKDKEKTILLLKEAAEETAAQRFIEKWTGFLKRDFSKEIALEIESVNRNKILEYNKPLSSNGLRQLASNQKIGSSNLSRGNM